LKTVRRSCPFLNRTPPSALRRLNDGVGSAMSMSSASEISNQCPHLSANQAEAEATLPSSKTAGTSPSPLFQAAQKCPVMGTALAVQSRKMSSKAKSSSSGIVNVSDRNSNSRKMGKSPSRSVSASPKGRMASLSTPNPTRAGVEVPPIFPHTGALQNSPLDSSGFLKSENANGYVETGNAIEGTEGKHD
jgi:hypothetical protein